MSGNTTEFVLVLAEVSNQKKTMKGAGIAELKKNETIFDFINQFYTDRKFHLLNKSFVLSNSISGYLLTVNHPALNGTYRFVFSTITHSNIASALSSLNTKETKRDKKAIDKLKESV